MRYEFGSLNDLAGRVHCVSMEHGFWAGQDIEDVYLNLAKLALITSEIGEAVEAVRIRDWQHLEEELADILIRVLDLAAAHEMNIEQAVLNKNAINEQRPWLHNKLA